METPPNTHCTFLYWQPAPIAISVLKGAKLVKKTSGPALLRKPNGCALGGDRRTINYPSKGIIMGLWAVWLASRE